MGRLGLDEVVREWSSLMMGLIRAFIRREESLVGDYCIATEETRNQLGAHFNSVGGTLEWLQER